VKRQEVWITGVGTATPLGNSYSEAAEGFLAGRSGVRPLTRFDVSTHTCQIAGQIGLLPPPPGWDGAAFHQLDQLHQLLFWCAVQALQDAGLWDRRRELRMGIVLGLGAEWMLAWELDIHRGGDRANHPEQDRPSLVNDLRQLLDVRGPTGTVAAACASGNYALAQGRRWLDLGWVDVCLAGACDLPVTPMALAGFGNLRALSRRTDAPTAASRPFDRGRDGFVMGEGGALFVLEPAAAARRRGAHAYAEFAGFGSTSDAFHMIIPSSDPKPAARALRMALDDAGANPDEVHYLNAHATSTPVGDRAEARVLQMVLGSAIDRVAVSSTKSMTGHLISAAAAVEALACLVALDRQAAPPTINLDEPDPECALCHVPHQAREQPVRLAVSNSFGFGGSNACLVLRKVA
jgi:3-oxoacyl-[acyl-carrier-protein] synthase II